MRLTLGFLVPFVLLAVACSSVPTISEQDRSPAAIQAAVPLQSPSEIDKILEETNPVLAEMSAADGEKVPLQIPLEINRKVAEWIKFFSVRERDLTQRYLERGEALRPHIEQILRENEVPQELFYLAMIESGFVSHAKSRAKAVGVWQFMKGTARNYGLSVNTHVDERRSWIKATEAAASYLKDLNNVFGSWYLALAAYNAGEHRIVRSIMKGKTRDFWALAEAGLLPKETLNYVPKFLAAHIVGKNFRKFGFDIKVADEDKWDQFESVAVPGGVKLADIARVSGVSADVLKRWNFDLIRGITPYSKTGSVEIYIPKSDADRIESVKDQFSQLQRFKTGFEDQRSYASSGAGEDRPSYSVYVVRRGENLSSISRRLGLSLRTLMKINGLRKGKIHPGQRLKYYRGSGSEVEAKTTHRNLASIKTPRRGKGRR